MPDKQKRHVICRTRPHNRDEAIPELPFQVLAPDERPVANCATREIAQALAHALDGIKVVVHIEGGCVTSARSSYERVELEIFDQDNLACGEESEGTDTNDQDAMAAAVAEAEEKAEERYNTYPYPIY